MSLKPIPNQPINLLPSEIIGGCPESDYATLIAEGDTVLLQFEQTRCEGATQYIGSPNFQGVDWRTNTAVGFTVQFNGGVCAVTNNGGSVLDNTGFTPGGGNLYELVVNVTSVQGSGFRISVGGLSFDLTGIGEYAFTFTAQNAGQLEIKLIDDTSAGCIASVFVYDGNTSFELAIVDSTGADVAAINPGDDPWAFTYSGRNVVVEWPLPVEVQGCIGFVLRDQCVYGETVEWCSQPFKVVDCEGTVKLRVCNDDDALGFVAGRFEVRVEASVVRPTWEYEVSEERLSNGQINRHFIDRQAAYQFLIEIQNNKLHPFLAAMAMFDHFYIGDGEWSIDADGYAPGYGEALTGAGGVALSVRKVKELARKVLCVDAGEGCAPVNDPICNTADVTISTVFVDEELFIRVDVLSSLGFEVSQIDWSLNGVPQTAVSVGGVPGPYALGAVEAGDTVQITFVNAQDPLCNDVRAAFVVVAPECGIEGDAVQIILGNESSEGAGLLAAWGSDGYWSIVYNGGAPQTFTNGDQGGYLGAGSYCIYPSDDEGNPSGTFGEDPLNAGSLFAFADVEVLGADYDALATGELHQQVITYWMPVTSNEYLVPYAKQQDLDAQIFTSTDVGAAVIRFAPGAWTELAQIGAIGVDPVASPTPILILWPAALPILFIELGGIFIPSNMDELANLLIPANAGIVLASAGSNVTPTSASQVARQALYDGGWTLPASWTADLTT
jgi:hypothetical protein